jgi:6-pyruvoyltetrahydropterin/6-carboxytetrahydropterin synthase
MYTVAVRREFVAQHFLIGGDWGAENVKHSHHYVVEVQLHGHTLDAHGYLVDIVQIEAHLDAVAAYWRDQTLNEKPEFVGLNPSIEHFSRIICEQLVRRIEAPGLSGMTVQLWENAIAWASWHQNLA